MLLFDRPRQHDHLAGAARRQRKPSRRRAHPGQRPQHRAKPPGLDPQPCAMRSYRRASLGMPAQRALPETRLRAMPRPAREPAQTTPDAVRARPPCLRHARHAGTHPRRAPSMPATPRLPRAAADAPRHALSGRAAGVFSMTDALSTSAISAGIPASRAARSARTSAARAGLVRRCRIAIPATTLMR